MNFPDLGQLNWGVSKPYTRVKKSSRKQITFPDAYSQKLIWVALPNRQNGVSWPRSLTAYRFSWNDNQYITWVLGHHSYTRELGIVPKQKPLS